MRETPFIVFGDDWGRNVSTLQHLFRQILPQRRVLWVNSINHRTPRLTWYDARRAVGKLAQMAFAPQNSAPPINGESSDKPAFILTPRILPWYNNQRIQSWNTKSLLRDINLASRLHFRGEAPVVVSGTPVIREVVCGIDAIARIYFCMDDYAELPGVDRALLEPLERDFVRAVDGVIATAAHLAATRRPPSNEAYHLPQGVNFSHFSRPRGIPSDLARLPRPIIGFAGRVSDGCDQEVILQLSTAFPEGSVVLVGAIATDVSRLVRPNIHLLGNRPYDELPAYVQNFDVGIINYIMSDWMRAVDPLKLLEYLSAGIPVVSTNLPEVQKYAEVVRIASGADAFVAACRDALQSRTLANDASRQAFASQHTWHSRSTRFIEHVQSICRVAGRGEFL